MATNKEKFLAAAVKLVEKGQNDKAVKEYLKVVAEDDKDIRVWLKIGDLFVKLAKHKEAADAYQKVAQFYSEQGNYRKAVAVYKQIVKIEPRLVDVQQKLADLCKDLGIVSDALLHYEAVASFYQSEGRTRDALKAFKQMVDLEPDNVASRIKLAELYSKESMTRESVQEFTRAAEYLKDHDRVDDFMKVAERLLFLSPDNYGLAREIAGLYINRGDARRALPKLQLCFKADPRDIETLKLLASAFEALGQNPKTLSVLKELARIHAEDGDTRRRDETFRRILSLAPDDPDAIAAVGRPVDAPRPIAAAPPMRVAQPVGQIQPVPLEERVSHEQLRNGAPGFGESEPTFAAKARRAEASAEQAALDNPPLPVKKRRVVARNGAMGTPGPTFLEGEEDSTTDSGDREEEISRILSETEVYRKYNMHAKAVEHVVRVFDLNPYHLEARERLAYLYEQLRQTDDAINEYWTLYSQVGATSRGEGYVNEVLRMRPGDERALQVQAELSAALPPPPVAQAARSISVEAPRPSATESMARPMTTLEMESVDADDIVDMGDEVVVDEEEAAIEVPNDDDILVVAADESRVATPAARVHSAATTTPPGAYDPEAPSLVQEMSFPVELGHRASSVAQGPLEDGLDEADYFAQHGRTSDARAILTGLLARFPGHVLVAAKLADLDAATPAGGSPEPPNPFDAEDHTSTENRPALARGADEFTGETRVGGGSERSVVARIDAAALGFGAQEDSGAAPVPVEDFDTHYDLGIAYKEMGLLDDAVAEFKIVMADPKREVMCFTMIGLIYLDKGRVTDAIQQFKSGLYADSISDREQLALYYELGNAYERIDDAREALYYYEKVLKRDPTFRDIDRRITKLRGGSNHDETLPAAKDEIDAALDGLGSNSGK